MINYTICTDQDSLVGKTIKLSHITSRECLIRFTDNSILCMRASHCYDDVVLEVTEVKTRLDTDDLLTLEIITQEEYDQLEAEETANQEALQKEYKWRDYYRLKEELGIID